MTEIRNGNVSPPGEYRAVVSGYSARGVRFPEAELAVRSAGRRHRFTFRDRHNKRPMF
jgi:hypothetical protein